jgi:prepilin-type N-terminal cleavage/methylation domain-containing protein
VIHRLARAARGQRGYTLTELVAVLAIFLTIVTALVSLFTSGAKAELDLNRRFEAQQNARLALDRLRREAHCATSVTKTNGDALTPGVPFGAMKVWVPTQCVATGAGFVVYEMASVSAGRWKLNRGGAVLADYFTTGTPFTYYPQSSSSRATLHVDLPVNVAPNEGWKQWRLVDDIVLRNSLRQ